MNDETVAPLWALSVRRRFAGGDVLVPEYRCREDWSEPFCADSDGMVSVLPEDGER